jgi:hypothetical protein
MTLPLLTEMLKNVGCKEENNLYIKPLLPPNGLRYLRVGGCGFCLGVGKARSQKNA